MENSFFILIFVFMLAILISAVAVIKPFGRFFPDRKRAALIHLGCWIGMFITAGVAGSLDPKIQQEIEIKRKEEQRQEALRVQEDQKAAQNKLAGEAAKLEAEAKGLWAGILAAAGPCDEASKKVSQSFSNSVNPYALYPVVESAKDTCMTASIELGKLKPPSSVSGDAFEAFETALDNCDTAYGTRSYALGQMLDVVNGESRPSDVQEAVEAMEVGSQAPLRCVAEFTSALGKAGLSDDAVMSILGSKR